MIVTLIGKQFLARTKLPQATMGNYWIVDNNEKKLISIEGNKEGWRIISNNNIKILRPKSILSVNISKIVQAEENIIPSTILKEYGMYYVYLKDYPNDICILYCSPQFEENYIHLNIKNSQEILIGSGKECHIVYNNPLIKKVHARIFFSNGKLMLENFDTDYEIFINNNFSNKKLKMLFNGDIIFIMGLKIIILGRSIYINNPAKRVTYSKEIFEEKEININVPKIIEENDEEVEIHLEKNYFARAPRIVKIIEREKIKIDAPPHSENKEGMPLLYALGSSLSMGVIMMISIISATDRLATGNATVRNTIFSILTSVVLLISMLCIPLLMRRWEKKQKNKNERKRQTKYREYINSKIELIDNIMKKQKEILYENYISAEECAKIVINNKPRLWERKIQEDDFLTVRIGIGDIPIIADIEYPQEEFSLEDDNLMDILNTVVNKSKIIKNVPITISLTQKNIVALVVKNDDRIVEKFVQNLIMQLVALHSYADLKLVFLLKEDKTRKWEHFKNLPHIWDNSKQIRFWAEDYSDMREVSNYLEMEFNERTQYENLNYRSFMPYYLIITDDYKKIENLSIIRKILGIDENIGFGIFCITNNLVDLPSECKAFINVENNIGEMFENEISSKNRIKFTFDSSYTFFFEKIGKQLSNIPIKYETVGKTGLPESLTFLEMYDVGKIEQLNILERWKTHNATNSLQAPIGIDTSGMPIVLDIHERFHGPHGLIAGSTGSGKSEFIKTYILSLTINYHPDDVAIIIIDYKGGDVAGVFQRKNAKLPHLVGTITNIETAGLQRSLASIQSELKRRQILFNEVRNMIDDGNIDIYKYQKLYHDGVLKNPIPHLLIICDEFAELKQQQPEFMNELISVARIGRSLGVHLILATQKPAGIVNEQIRSNSKFGVCLKVQDKGDSIDVIRRPDAAELKKTGQFYLQVGNNEYFTLGLSAWSGAPYFPADIIKKEVDSSIKFVSDIGTVVKEVGKSKKQKTRNSGEQITSIVKYMAELAEIEHIQTKPLWLANIPAIIFIEQLKKKYKINNKRGIVRACIGEFDDPENQRQGIVEINLSNHGNVAVFGNAESGKETFLSTLIYDIMTTYKTQIAQMYIIDCGSGALKIFRDSPSVGDVILSSDEEKTSRLFDMLQNEIKKRNIILSNYGGDYNLYIKANEEKMPMIIVIINNYERFSENYKDKYDEILLTLSREGSKYGIVFIVSADSYGAIRYRLNQNFREKIALQLNNQDEYIMIFNKVNKKRPANIFGRGLIEIDNNIYEFQTARICESEKWNEYIKETNDKLTKINNIFAKPIPVLPNKVTLKDVKPALKDLTSVPIGICKATLEIYSYNFNKNFINFVTGKNIDTMVQFFEHVLEEIKQLKNVSLEIFDAEQILQTDKVNLDEFYKNFMIKINSIAKEKVLCVIIGLSKFINSMEEGAKGFYEMLLQAKKVNNCNFIILENYKKIKNCEYDEWYKNLATNDSGIWVGNGITEQYLININLSDRSIINRCGESFGYVIKKEKVTLIKLLGMKENGDEDG